MVLLALVVRFALSPLPGYDLRDYRLWAGLVARDGVAAIYHADIFIPYNYPPVFLYVLDVLNRIYMVFMPVFDADSLLLGLLLKTPATLADAAIALIVYLFLLKRVSLRLALLGALSYALNPAVIWNSAYWGGIDALHSLFALLAIVFLTKGKPEAAWSLLTLSVLTKPLSVPIAIVVGLVTLVQFDLKRLALSVAAAVGTALAAVLPFAAAGALGEMGTALVGNVGNYNNISANAHNFWWLVSGGQGWTKDTDLLVGIASYRITGLALLAGFGFWSLTLLYKESRDSLIFCVGAVLSLAVYMLPTEVHENWVFGAFPFLAVAAVLEPRFRLILVALTVTFWLNMALHDLHFSYELPKGWLGSFLAVARMANSAANNLIFFYAAWSLLHVYRRADFADLASDKA